MKFNPSTNEVFTDEGNLIKRLSCPYKIKWDALADVENTTKIRSCSICDHHIIDTAFLNDKELVSIMKINPDTCLKIDLNQSNIKIITSGSHK